MGGYSYRTPPWEVMQESINLMCEWCDLVCEEIEFYYHAKTKTRDSLPPRATFHLTVRFERPVEASTAAGVANENHFEAYRCVVPWRELGILAVFGTEGLHDRIRAERICERTADARVLRIRQA